MSYYHSFDFLVYLSCRWPYSGIGISKSFYTEKPYYGDFPKKCNIDPCLYASPNFFFGGRFLVDRTWNTLVIPEGITKGFTETHVVELPFTPQKGALVSKSYDTLRFLFWTHNALEEVTYTANGNMSTKLIDHCEEAVGLVWEDGTVVGLICYDGDRLYRYDRNGYRRPFDEVYDFQEIHVMRFPTEPGKTEEMRVYKEGYTLRVRSKSSFSLQLKGEVIQFLSSVEISDKQWELQTFATYYIDYNESLPVIYNIVLGKNVYTKLEYQALATCSENLLT